MPSPVVLAPRRPIPLPDSLTAWVSPEDWRRVMRHKWCALRRHGHPRYAQANIKIGDRWTRVLLHRFILNVASNELIDHKDKDGFNCVRDNLRVATRGQNQHNSGPRSGKYKGVTWHKRAGKWLAQIMAGNKYQYLGLHETEEA